LQPRDGNDFIFWQMLQTFHVDGKQLETEWSPVLAPAQRGKKNEDCKR